MAEKSIGEITLLSGGFPCQPHSVNGKRLASSDERDLWDEFARIIREVRPKWVLGENVSGLLSSENGRFFGRVLRDLAEAGYHAGWGVFTAFNAGAIHRRERVFIVSNAVRIDESRVDTNEEIRCGKFYTEINRQGELDTNGILTNALRSISGAIGPIHRNDDGLPSALDRFKCCGNAVMPQQVYPILAAIAAAEGFPCD